MKLSEIARLPSFALLGPGFTGGPLRLITPLQPSHEPSVVFVPYESTAAGASKWSGPASDIELEREPEPPPLSIGLDSAGHAEAVATIREAIANGDVYQVNHTLRASLGQASPEQIFATLTRRAVPRYAAWVRSGDGTEFISASPELFFSIYRRTILSQPMKGTAAPDRLDSLRRSEKDTAELAMITDLVRNDLTPICEPRSVRVERERHFLELPYAVQAVSEVSGQLLPSSRLDDVLDALHPGGSVTGAPKNAARQMIAGLESTPRGAYCGTLGYIAGEHSVFSLLIRTATRTATGWVYGVGGGIVWDSDAAAELEEIHIKLGALR